LSAAKAPGEVKATFHSTPIFLPRQSQQIPASLSPANGKVQRAIAAQFNFNKQLNRNKRQQEAIFTFSRGCSRKSQ